ncbi:MAG: tetratricopeptide repeat protein [Planctomycetota bacterium]
MNSIWHRLADWYPRVKSGLLWCVCFVPLHDAVMAASPGQPVVARTEMRFADGQDVIDVIEKGDLLTVVEVRDAEYVILTHDGTQGVVDKVNAVELAESTDIYSQLIEANPNEGRYHTLRASAWWALGKNEQALDDFNTAIQKGYRQPHAYSSRGLFHAANGDPDRAIADYEQALRLDPDDVTPIINRGAVYMSTGQFDRAIEDYTSALAVRRGNAALLRQRAIALKASGQLDLAIKDFDSILETNPEDVAAIMGRGYVRFQKREYASAAADFSAALELNPTDPVAWNNRGYNRYQIGRAAEALQDYDKAIELEPEFALAHQNRAWLLATTTDESLQDPSEAVRAAKRACEITSYNSVGDLSALAAALAANGQFETAVGWQEKVVEAAPPAVQTFASQMLQRYRDGKTYVADPVAAQQAEQEAATAEAAARVKTQNEAAKAAAAKQLEERAKQDAAAERDRVGSDAG